MSFSLMQSMQTFSVPHPLAEGVFIAESIQQLVVDGVPYSDIAIITRRHSDLEALAHVLQYHSIPVSYERKRNVLDVQQVNELVIMLRFVASVSSAQQPAADQYLPDILQYPFWGIQPSDVWRVSLYAYAQRISWLEALQQADQIPQLSSPSQLSRIAEFFLSLAGRAVHEPAERIFDDLMGVNKTPLADDEYDDDQSESSAYQSFHSPFKQYYFDDHTQSIDVTYLDILSAIRVLISAVRDFRVHRVIKAHDVIEYLDMLEQHNKPLLDTTVFGSAQEAVNILTAHGSKGLEFDTVFVARATQKIWFPAVRGKKLGHPSNLQLSPQADTIDDKLRLFFVAVTRAKKRLIVTFPCSSLDGKLLNPVPVIADDYQDIPAENFSVETLSELASVSIRTDTLPTPQRRDVLAPVLEKYQLPVTHLINFVDLERGGPQLFLQHNLLRFPQAKTPSSGYGTAMHAALKWWHDWQRTNPDTTLNFDELTQQFMRVLDLQRLLQHDFKIHGDKGKEALKFYYTQQNGRVDPSAIIEKNFKYSGSVIGKNEAKLAGQIDKMYLDGNARTISVTDFKTGKPLTDWAASDSKSWKYDMQLAFYKILIEQSREYAGYTVQEGTLEFLDSGVIGKHQQIQLLSKSVTPAETEYLAALIDAVWYKIQCIASPDPELQKKSLPDVSDYPKTLKGSRQFCDDLIEGRV